MNVASVSKTLGVCIILINSIQVLAINSVKFDLSTLVVNGDTQFSADVTLDNISYIVDFYPIEVRDKHYQMLKQISDGNIVQVHPFGSKQYLGRFQNKSNRAHILLSAIAEGWQISVVQEDSISNFVISTRPKANSTAKWRQKSTSSPKLMTNPDSVSIDKSLPLGESDTQYYTEPNRVNSCMIKEVELALDCDYSCYQYFNQDENQIAAMADELMLKMNALYLRDLRLGFKLTTLLVRTSADEDPYNSSTDQGAVLSKLATDWESATDRGNYDLAALIQNRFNGAGIAYLGSVCSPYRYSANSITLDNGDPFVVMRHEIGHNLGSDHYEGGSPEGTTIMSGNSINRISGPEVDAMLTNYNAQCLAEVSPPSGSIYPYAKYDSLELDKPDTVLLTPLNNDYDANCDQLDFDSLSTRNQLQGNATLDSMGQIRYEPPSISTEDNIYYLITDQNGNQSEGLYKVTYKSDQPTQPPTTSTQSPTTSKNSNGGCTASLLFLLWCLIFHRLSRHITE